MRERLLGTSMLSPLFGDHFFRKKPDSEEKFLDEYLENVPRQKSHLAGFEINRAFTEISGFTPIFSQVPNRKPLSKEDDYLMQGVRMTKEEVPSLPPYLSLLSMFKDVKAGPILHMSYDDFLNTYSLSMCEEILKLLAEEGAETPTDE